MENLTPSTASTSTIATISSGLSFDLPPATQPVVTQTSPLPQKGPMTRDYRFEGVLDHGDTPIACWRQSSAQPVTNLPWMAVDSGAFEARAIAAALPVDAPIFICLGETAPNEFIAFATVMASAPQRVYIASANPARRTVKTPAAQNGVPSSPPASVPAASDPTPSDWAPEPWCQAMLSKRHPTAAIRRVPGLAQSFIATETSAWIALGTPGQSARWILEVDADAARVLRALFGHVFWRKADGEYIPFNSDAFNTPAKPPRPLSDDLNSHHLGGTLGPRANVHLSAGASHVIAPVPADLLDGSPRFLVTRPSGVQAVVDVLAELADTGARIAWQDLGLPATAISNGSRPLEFLLDEGDVRVLLRLPKRMAAQLQPLVEDVAHRAEWHFESSVRVADLTDKVWLPGQHDPVAIADQAQPVRHTRELDDLRRLLDVQLAFAGDIPFRHARRTPYSMGLKLPMLPKGAASTHAGEAWKRAERDFADALRSIGHLCEHLGNACTAVDLPSDIQDVTRQVTSELEMLPDIHGNKLPTAFDDAIASLSAIEACRAAMSKAARNALKLDGNTLPKNLRKPIDKCVKTLDNRFPQPIAQPEHARPVGPQVVHCDGQAFVAVHDWAELDAACVIADPINARVVIARRD